jgi:hypothetical protein
MLSVVDAHKGVQTVTKLDFFTEIKFFENIFAFILTDRHHIIFFFDDLNGLNVYGVVVASVMLTSSWPVGQEHQVVAKPTTLLVDDMVDSHEATF